MEQRKTKANKITKDLIALKLSWKYQYVFHQEKEEQGGKKKRKKKKEREGGGGGGRKSIISKLSINGA